MGTPDFPACGADFLPLTAMLEHSSTPSLLLDDCGKVLWSNTSARLGWADWAQPGSMLPERIENLKFTDRTSLFFTIAQGTIEIQPLKEGWVAYLSRWSPIFDMTKVADAFPLPVFLLDRNDIYRGCNSAMAEFFGVSRDAIIGKSIAEGCGPSLAAKAFFMEKALLEQGASGTITYEWEWGDSISSRRWALIHKANVTDAEGRICGTVGTISDITEFRRNEHKFTHIFNLCPESITVTDKATGQYLDVNEAYESLTGHLRAEALHHTSLELGVWVEPGERNDAWAALEESNGQLRNFETRFRRKDGTIFPALISADETEIFGTTCIIMATRDISEQKESAERLIHTLNQTIEAIALTVEKRDPYTAGHQQRVSELATAIARELGLPDDRVEGLRLGGIIHDIGKIYLPAEILSRPSRLSDAEFALVKTHAEVGYEIVRSVDFPWPVATLIHQHHERLDGSGYPHGLKEDEILLEAQILAVADVVEAMASHRPYRPGLGIEKALDHVRQMAGRHFNVDAVAACIHLFADKGFQLQSPRAF